GGRPAAVARRIVLIAPSERQRLPVLKQAGFTGYLVKPVRAASLAAQMTAKQDIFERATSEAGAPDIADARVDGNASGLAILVAEDNEINALLARPLLERLGHRPTVAPTGDAAAEARP